MMRANVIVKVLGLLLFLGVATPGTAPAQSRTEKQVDSLFVIASSGEVKFKALVQPAIEAIAAMGVDAVPRLIDKLTTKSARERVTLMAILKKIGSPAVPLLVRALSRPEDLVVERVCAALGDIADSAAVEPLMSVTTRPRWQVRDQAVGALGKIKSRRADQAVLTALEDSVGQVRKAAAVAAGLLGIREAVPGLIHVLGDDFYGARWAAVRTLIGLDTGLVTLALADSLNSDNRFVGDLGCYVLGRLPSERGLELLFRQTESVSPERRAHAAAAIALADPKDVCGWHQQLLEGETDRLTRLKIASALKALERGQ
jgi:HEAT repeat protein